MRRQAGFFDVDDRWKRLSDLGDQLEAFEAAVEFEAFRPELNAALTYSDGTQGGRPPFDPVMMFKILVIQTPRVCAMLQVPLPEEVDRRQGSRELKTLTAERVRMVNRIKGLLFAQCLDQLRTGDGRPLCRAWCRS